jgi:sulfite exporter TauE/SafE
MLGSITPLGERGRDRNWGRTVTAYVAGSALAGLVVGAALGALGRPVASGLAATTRLGVLAAVVALGLAADLRLGGLRLPTVHRQVNEEWMVRYRDWVYGLGFGLQLGTGVVTVVTTSAVYAMWVAALLSGSMQAGALIGLTFGLVRSVAVFAVAGVRRPDQLGRVDAALRRWDARTRRAALGAAALVTVALTAGAVR